ncbi:MAG: hypothetical protein KF819_02080 [Labilithrix sp.]|nr:hypothetical protein [Labilithrix sp.]
MQCPSRCRGASFVEYLVVIGAALAFVVAAAAVYRTSFGQGAVCLAAKIVGQGGSACMADAPKTVAAASTMTDVNGTAGGVCDSSGKCTNGACFTAETLVATPDGARPIASIAAGDLVVAKDFESGEIAPRRVLATKVTLDKPSLRLELRTGEILNVTDNHPFWREDHGWTAAGDLAPGDRIATPSGAAVVASLAQRAAIEPVYNIEVEGAHTYFVGRAQVLVHNDCDISAAAWEKAYGVREAEFVIRMATDLAAAQKAYFDALKAPRGPSMHAPGFDPELARMRSLAAQRQNLATSQSDVETMMAQILHSPNADPRAKRMIAQAIADGKHTPAPAMPMFDALARPSLMMDEKQFFQMQRSAWSGEALRVAMGRYAVAAGTPEMKEKAAALLAPIGTFHPNQAYDVFSKKFQYVLERAQKSEEPSVFKDLARLLYAKELGNDPKWADKVNKDLLETKLERMWKDPVVVKKLTELHNETISDVKWSNAYRSHVAMLESEAFLLRLQLLPAAEAKKTLELEIAKVAAIDAREARFILDRIVGRQIMADFHQQADDVQADALGKSIDHHIAELAKNDAALKDFTKYGVKAPADVLKRIASVLKAQQAALAANRTAEATTAIDKIVEDAAKAGQISPAQKTALGKVFHLIEKGDKHGGVSAVAATAGMIALGIEVYDGSAFKNTDKTLMSVATLSKTVGSADAYAKLGAWALAKKLPESGKFFMALRIAKFAGPVGDALTVVVDGRSAYVNFSKGNVKEAVCDVGAAGCAVTTAIAGIAIASGATGPAAPIAMLVGTVGYLGFKGIKWMVTDPDEIKLLKEAGVFRDMSGAALAAVHAREIRKYAGSCTSDRRHCPGPIGEEARRILDGDKRGLPPLDLLENKQWQWEASVIAVKGAKFYKDHGAPPGSCKNCH